ncbi:MAG TPA: hypothetical protein VHM88_26540, partial [Candidatus Acidoferrales bacterium]|nr:hypothetical protein [Candidatus Acidoferrales bacterium]
GALQVNHPMPTPLRNPEQGPSAGDRTGPECGSGRSAGSAPYDRLANTGIRRQRHLSSANEACIRRRLAIPLTQVLVRTNVRAWATHAP